MNVTLVERIIWQKRKRIELVLRPDTYNSVGAFHSKPLIWKDDKNISLIITKWKQDVEKGIYYIANFS